MLLNTRKPGTESSKNTLFLEPLPSSRHGLSDGHTMVTQELRVHTTAQSELQIASAASLPTCTTRLACSLASTFLEQMLRCSQASGSTKSDPAAVLTLETTCGCLATCLDVLLKTTMWIFPLHQSCLVTGMVQAAILISPLRPCVKERGE